MRDRKTLDDRGFTLVELIVGIAILVIVAGAALGFMMTSTKTYKNVSDDVDLQEEAQIVMNQLETLVMNAGKGVNFMYKGKTITEDPADSVDVEGFSYSASDIDTSSIDVDYKILYIYNEENRYVVTYDVKNKKLLYREEARLTDETGTKYINSFEDKSGSDALMCEYLEDFDVSLNANSSKVVLNASLSMEKGVKTYKTNQNFFLRNSIALNSNVASIYPDTPEVATTYNRMVVKMGGKSFYSDTTNVYDVMITDSDHVVPFYVSIEGNGYPSQEYIAVLTGPAVDEAKEKVQDNNTLAISKDVNANTCYLTCTSKVNPSLSVTITINVSAIRKCNVEKGSSFDPDIFYCGNQVELQKENSLVAYVDGLKGQTKLNGTPIAYTWYASYEKDGKTYTCTISNGNILQLPMTFNQDIKVWATAKIGNIDIGKGTETVVTMASYNLVVNNRNDNEMYYVPYAATGSATKINGADYYYYVKYHAGGQKDQNYNANGSDRLLPWYELYLYRNEQDASKNNVWKRYTKIAEDKQDDWTLYWSWSH